MTTVLLVFHEQTTLEHLYHQLVLYNCTAVPFINGKFADLPEKVQSTIKTLEKRGLITLVDQTYKGSMVKIAQGEGMAITNAGYEVIELFLSNNRRLDLNLQLKTAKRDSRIVPLLTREEEL